MNKKSIIIGLVATFGFISNAMADNLLEAMDSDGGYKILLGAIKTAGLESTFKGAGPLTVFAPTDDAFKALPKAKLDELLKNPAELKKVISYSVVPAKV
ncbi:MAG TPA: fasciclin domain-containing protein, partial [Methylophilaceae bacterium]